MVLKKILYKFSFSLSIILLLNILGIQSEKVIKYENYHSSPYTINEETETFKIEFISKSQIPNYLHIIVESENNIQQKLYFSNSDSKCFRERKFNTEREVGKEELIIQHSDLVSNQVYFCIKCEGQRTCNFILSLISEITPSKDLKGISTYSELPEPFEDEDGNLRNLDDTGNTDEEIILYVQQYYTDKLSIPADLPQYYQIQADPNSTFSERGQCITVTKEGLVVPRNTTYYYYGNSYTTAKRNDTDPDKVVTKYDTGNGSVVVINSTKSAVKTIKFQVVEYSSIYAEKILDEYARTNLSSLTDELEKLQLITDFPAQYDYNENYSGYSGMIINGGGDCWASTSVILYLCNKANLTAHMRYAANDPTAYSGHRNVAVLINNKTVYVADAGYSGKAPRYHTVTEENVGFYARGNTLYQYDGWEHDITVPEMINNNTITQLYTNCFWVGKTYSGVAINSVILPDTIEILRNASLYALGYKTFKIPKKLKRVDYFVFSQSPDFVSFTADDAENFDAIDGILYTKNLSELVVCPTKLAIENYTLPDEVESIHGYAFYYTTTVKNLNLSSRLTFVGEGGFGDSKISSMNFTGDLPTFSPHALHGLKLTAYYPKGNPTWKNVKKLDKYEASSLDWVGYGNKAQFLVGATVWSLVMWICLLL